MESQLVVFVSVALLSFGIGMVTGLSLMLLFHENRTTTVQSSRSSDMLEPFYPTPDAVARLNERQKEKAKNARKAN